LKIQTGISNAGLFLIIIFVVVTALVYFIYLYKKDKDEFSKIQRYILSPIRFVYLFLIAFLVLSPLIEIIKNRLEKPLLILGIDNSESMAVDSANFSFIKRVREEIGAKTDRKFDLQILTFGEKVNLNTEPDYSDKISNYSDFVDEINKRYYNLNVGAVVIVGDGIYNEGKNPDQLIDQITSPVYAIGVGDTTAKSDQAIIDVTHNENVFSGNSFPVEIEATFSNFHFPTSQLLIYLEDKLVFSEIIKVPQADYYYNKTINLKAEKPGLQNVTITLSPFINEQNTANNRYQFSIEVHENKYNVLFLTQGPHPDIGALSIALSKQANFNVSVVDIMNMSEDLEKYNLIVLNQLPSLSLQQLGIFKKIADSRKSLLILIGPNTSISTLNNLGFQFSMTPSVQSQESFPYFNDSYIHFTLPANIKNVSTIYPPLLTYFTQYNVGSEYSVIAFQKINGIEMNYPLIATGIINNRKIGIITGEGIWRWRLSEFQNFDNQEVFDQLFVNLFNFLCLNEVREQFRVIYKHISPEIIPVRFKAQVYNEIFEPITSSEVKLSVSDSSNSELTYLFDANQMDYNLNIGFLKPGKYNFTASTKIGEKEFSKSGNFIIQEIKMEQQEQKADFKLLNSLSEKTGGKFFTSQNWQDLFVILDQNPDIKIKTHKEKNIHEMIDWKWYFIIIFLFFSLEWFLRKYWGSY
jgi:hypothetical protein